MVAENCTTHPLHKAQNLMNHPLSAPAHPIILYYTQDWDDCVVVCRLVSFFSASKTADTSSSANCILSLFFAVGGGNFPPSFPRFFFFSDGIFFGRHLRHLFVIRFIKSTLTTMFTITGIKSTVIPLIVSFKKGQW